VIQEMSFRRLAALHSSPYASDKTLYRVGNTAQDYFCYSFDAGFNGLKATRQFQNANNGMKPPGNVPKREQT